MAEMGKYCKAYLAKQFREYPGWSENAANVRKEKKEVDGKEVEVDRMLDDDSILYLQENYVVTDGIFKDQNIIFDNVTDEWKQFCHEDARLRDPGLRADRDQARRAGRDAGGQPRLPPTRCESPAPAGFCILGRSWVDSARHASPARPRHRDLLRRHRLRRARRRGAGARPRWSPASSPRTAPTAGWCRRSPRASTWPTGRR